MSGINNKPLLSICIPTWNRAFFLNESLNRLSQEYEKIDKAEVEIFVSDNCSDDNTEEVVLGFIKKGFAVTYNKNKENIGAAGNFLLCINRAKGKYILLLGDDDYLCENALAYILNLIRNKEYGLIHISNSSKMKEPFCEHDDAESFLKKVSFWITFMSGNLFRKDIVSKIINPERYIPTRLLQMAFFVTSALSYDKNLIIKNKGIMQIGVDVKNNGGFNPYEIFVKNYLEIWDEFRVKGLISNSFFSYIKKDLYLNLILEHNVDELILRKNIADESLSASGGRKGYKISGAKHILKDYYGKNWYYYTSSIKMIWKVFDITIRGIANIYLCRE